MGCITNKLYSLWLCITTGTLSIQSELFVKRSSASSLRNYHPHGSISSDYVNEKVIVRHRTSLSRDQSHANKNRRASRIKTV